jgi:hypothetical protein
MTPAQRDGALDPGPEVLAAAASRQKRRVHPLDVNPTVLHGFDAVLDLDELARGGIRIGEGTLGHELFHAAARSSFSAPPVTIFSASSLLRAKAQRRTCSRNFENRVLRLINDLDAIDLLDDIGSIVKRSSLSHRERLLLI